MKLSVMFITHNRKQELIRAIKSCLNNKIDDMEFVIVDNDSNDGTKEAINELMIHSGIEFTYFFSEKNLGVSGGRNKAFSLCKGEYVFCLDDDAILHTANFFEQTYQYMEQDEKIGALAYKVYEPETNSYLISHALNNHNNERLCLSYVGGAHTLRRNLFEKNIYPDKLFFGSEELYASYTIWDKKCKVKYVEDLVVHHIPSKINRTCGKERDYNFILNQYIIKLLKYPYITWAVLTIFLILRLIKNKLFNMVNIKRIISDLIIRYNKNERIPIAYNTLWMLIKKFGIKNIF